MTDEQLDPIMQAIADLIVGNGEVPRAVVERYIRDHAPTLYEEHIAPGVIAVEDAVTRARTSRRDWSPFPVLVARGFRKWLEARAPLTEGEHLAAARVIAAILEQTPSGEHPGGLMNANLGLAIQGGLAKAAVGHILSLEDPAVVIAPLRIEDHEDPATTDAPDAPRKSLCVRIDRLESAVGALHRDLGELERDLTDLASRVDAGPTPFDHETTMAGVESRLDDVESRLDDLGN